MNRNKLKKESDRWLSHQIIDTTQRDRILALYPESERSYWMLAFAIIGAVLCLGGTILIIASNWQNIPPLVKFIGLLVLLISSFTFAVESQRRKMPRGYMECAWLLASIFPLLGLALISQIFHLEGKTSTLLLAWCLLIFPLPFLSGSISALVTWLISLTLLVGWSVTDWLLPHDSFPIFCKAYIAWGIICIGIAQIWKRAKAMPHAVVTEFWGLVVALLSYYIWGFNLDNSWLTSNHWQWMWFWFAEFLVCLGLIYRGYRYDHPHQVNLGFVFVGLIIISTFLRLVGTMMTTGLLFITGGISLLVLVYCLERLRRTVLRNISSKNSLSSNL